MIEIVPAVLATTEEQFRENIEQINNSEDLAQGWVQIDFADNTLVANQTVSLEVVKKISTSLQKEAHLMVSQPLSWLESLKNAGFSRVLVHVETDEVDKCLQKGQELGLEVGVVLNPETAVAKVEQYINKVVCIQVMTIEPGFQGQPFLPEMVKKVEELARIRQENGLHWEIAVDGGLNQETIPQVVAAGADRLVVGSALLKGDIDENLETIWETLHSES